MELEKVVINEVKEERNLTEKGYVQLPKMFRDMVGIEKRVDVILMKNCIVVKPHKEEEKEG